MTTAAHSIAHHTIHADGIFGGGDTSFSASYSGTLIKRPQKQHITLCSAETLHVYVIRGTSRCLPSLLNKRRAPIAARLIPDSCNSRFSPRYLPSITWHYEPFDSVTTAW